MGFRLIPQDKECKRFAIFSSYTDTFIELDLTEKEVLDWYENLAIEQSIQTTKHTIERFRCGYIPFSFNEAIRLHKITNCNNETINNKIKSLKELK